MAEAMQLDAALPANAKGTAILSCLSDDDIDEMVATLLNRLSKEQQTSFNQQLLTYNIRCEVMTWNRLAVLK